MSFSELRNHALEKIRSSQSLEDLQRVKAEILGKKGQITQLMRSIGSLPKGERPEAGKVLNQLKAELESEIKKQAELLRPLQPVAKSWIDVTLPGARRRIGHRHPVLKTLDEVENTFVSMGFEVVEGPEIEDTWHNFDALNTPEWHPARDEHDSFYIDGKALLRTHTSPVQIRTMLSNKPPIAIISPGRVYRKDYDATHLPMFIQVEGLYVDRNVTVAHLKYVLEQFVREIFDIDRKIRLRPSFFPFTEPSFEVDVS
ncbi:MAG: phenylalanine--tRNA ligase subunit alpha, partial [Thermotogae bacterium]